MQTQTFTVGWIAPLARLWRCEVVLWLQIGQGFLEAFLQMSACQ